MTEQFSSDRPSTAAGAAPIAVVIATTRRPAVVERTVRHFIENQTVRPDILIVSVVSPEDAGDLGSLPSVSVITGKQGLAAQRNAALAAIPEAIEIVAFFDDDFVADPNWLAVARTVFAARPEVVCLTGEVLADGINGPGLSFEEACEIVARAVARTDETVVEPYSPYGCNMAFRRSAIWDERFDERLILYGWLEDRDFGARLARNGGRLVKYSGARGVHMGVKGGRVAGERLGYSQIVNPLYMLRKGTMTVSQVADHIFRNMTSNLVLSLKPEPYVDRRGRLRGNIAALADIVRGRIEPERASEVPRSLKNGRS